MERLLLSIPFELEPRRLYTRALKYLGASWPLELSEAGGCLPRWPSSPHQPGSRLRRGERVEASLTVAHRFTGMGAYLQKCFPYRLLRDACIQLFHYRPQRSNNAFDLLGCQVEGVLGEMDVQNVKRGTGMSFVEQRVAPGGERRHQKQEP